MTEKAATPMCRTGARNFREHERLIQAVWRDRFGTENVGKAVRASTILVAGGSYVQLA